MLLTAMSRQPSWSTTAATMVSMSPSTRQFAATGTADPPSATIASTTASAWAGRTSFTATAAPARPSHFAISAPIPAPAPVTRVARPVRSMVTANAAPSRLRRPEPEDVLHHRLGPRQDGGLLDAAQRMLDDHHPGVGHPDGRRYLQAEVVEAALRRHQDGGDAGPFELYEVVDTPRRARPSIGASGEDDVDLAAQVIQHLLRARLGGVLHEMERSPGSGSRSQLLGHRQHGEAGVGLGVVARADACARQRAAARRPLTRGLGDVSVRSIDLHAALPPQSSTGTVTLRVIPPHDGTTHECFPGPP